MFSGLVQDRSTFARYVTVRLIVTRLTLRPCEAVLHTQRACLHVAQEPLTSLVCFYNPRTRTDKRRPNASHSVRTYSTFSTHTVRLIRSCDVNDYRGCLILTAKEHGAGLELFEDESQLCSVTLLWSQLTSDQSTDSNNGHIYRSVKTTLKQADDNFVEL